MSAALPPAASVPAPQAATLEVAFTLARAAARAAADPAAVLRDDSASLGEKLDALDALQDRIPGQKPGPQAASLDALAAAAADARQAPAFRAKALTLLGYAVPPTVNEAARGRAVVVLLAALAGDPAYRLFALRGLAPACHGLPKPLEPDFEDALLELLEGPSSGEERETALVALNAFVSGGADFPKRAPALLTTLDARFLAPIEADPAAFVRDPRWTPDARELAAAIVWIGARHRQADRDPAPAERVRLLLTRLIAVETDDTTLSWDVDYLTAAPPKPEPLTARTTKRVPRSVREP
jgi:hypothetical protein